MVPSYFRQKKPKPSAWVPQAPSAWSLGALAALQRYSYWLMGGKIDEDHFGKDKLVDN